MSINPPCDERVLLMRLREGDECAFEQLYHRHKRRVAASLITLLKSEVLAEEVLQDVFIKIWDTRAAIDPDRSFSAFLYRIGRNMVYDVFRRSANDQKLTAHLLSASAGSYNHVEEYIFAKEHAEIIHAAISHLPPQQRRVFTLFRLEGKSYKEISLELGISKATINEHIRKARVTLRRALPLEIPPTLLVLAYLLSDFYQA